MKDNPFGAGLVVFADIMKQYVGFFKKFPKTVGSITLAVLIYTFVPILGPYLNKVMIDRASYNFAYNLNPFWDDRVVIGMDYVAKDSKYLFYPTSKEIFEQDLLLNYLQQNIPGYSNQIKFDGETINASQQDVMLRTIDDKIIFFNKDIGKIYLLDEHDYNDLVKSGYKVKSNIKFFKKYDVSYEAYKRSSGGAYPKYNESNYGNEVNDAEKNKKSLPANFKDLPIFTFFENDFDMTEESLRFFLTQAATLESDAKKEKILMLKSSFYQYKKDQEDYKQMIINMPNHLLSPKDIQEKQRFLSEDKKEGI